VSESDSSRGAKREATTLAILDAAEKLFSERGFAAVSVRDIGQEAGVSHALVHRYLGTKQEIYRAVLRRNEDSIRNAAGATDDLAAAISLMLRKGLLEHRRYLRILAHSALSGLPFDSTTDRFPATERLIEIAEARAAGAPTAGPEGMAPRFAIAAIVSLYLGWAAMEPWILPATGLDGLDEEAIIDGLERVILGVAAQQLHGGDG
jgi:AcrR family transcriptional regulator